MVSGTDQSDRIVSRTDGTVANQVHIYSGLGNDRLDLSLATSAARSISHGHHVFTGLGYDAINFTDLKSLRGTVVGRLDDFNFSTDKILIEGVALDLSQPQNFANCKVSVVSMLNPSSPEMKDPQQWLQISTANGRALYALDGARYSPLGKEEAHFISAGTTLPAALPFAAYVSPIDSVQREHMPTTFAPTKGTSAADLMAGSSAKDVYVAGRGNDKIFGLGGHDFLFGDFGEDTISGGSGDDTLDGGKGNDRLIGADGNDVIYGGVGRDLIVGAAGGDKLYGGTDSDTIWAGGGNDYVHAGPGQDFIFGGEGDDFILGMEGNDHVMGGVGNDTLKGGLGRDSLYGGAGNDVIWGEDGPDTIWGGAGSDRIRGGRDNDAISAGTGNDFAWGGDGDDRVSGGDGDDSLLGGTGRDTIWGGNGSDRIWGAGGRDMLHGGEGRDTFVFRSTAEAGYGVERDVLLDFERSIDSIDLTGIDADTVSLGDQAFRYSESARPNAIWMQDVDGHSVLLQGDVNGDGRADFQVQIRGNGLPEIGDFLL